MNDIELKYATKDLADMLGVEPVTVRKYALALEKAGYVIDRSDGKNRSYSERDAMAFKYLQSIRTRTSITVDEAAHLIVQRNNADTASGGSIVRSDDGQISESYERYIELTMKVEQLMEIVRQQSAATTALPTPEQHRIDRLNDRLTERRIERQLKREALDLWAAKSEAERMKKVGLFRKEENIEARDRYVRDYIDEHYEQRMKEAYGYE